MSIDQFLHGSAALKSSVGPTTRLSGPHAQFTPLPAVIAGRGSHSRHCSKRISRPLLAKMGSVGPCRLGGLSQSVRKGLQPPTDEAAAISTAVADSVCSQLHFCRAAALKCLPVAGRKGLTTAAWIIHHKKDERCFYSSFQAG